MAESYKGLIVETGGSIARVTIDRPGDRNSVNSELMAEFEGTLADIEKTDARAVIFTGAGSTYFIGGADGIEMMQCTPEEAARFSRRIQALYEKLEKYPLITLAAIGGLCFGGGFEFALACDFRIASRTARIGLPEVKVGIIPGGGGTQRLPRVVGLGLATEMILSGKLYSGADALAMGLVHRAVPADGLIESAEAFLQKILRQPHYALIHAKRALRASGYLPLDKGQEVESSEFSRCFSHGFFVELMKKRLREGTLETTAELPAGFLDGGDK